MAMTRSALIFMILLLTLPSCAVVVDEETALPAEASGEVKPVLVDEETAALKKVMESQGLTDFVIFSREEYQKILAASGMTEAEHKNNLQKILNQQKLKPAE